ncbi:tRNA lysidine(34) synthetase TilS [Pelagicoccus sp. SDUM812005]|uniref:tRNA lysidine(34) synthetase TilS n=1 Tax=Pelagicoccus sp. SDUM812005 TaxID=3041257 RepID=UPI00280E5AF0|nr:tRNA lysidine(34) synthetase TilS [Pelagicoccus sp. SDUM812005]MDQ8179702.1 tRNA lysidine(34) synthetase TilS [Pelagicoccus sp. SDUM812005]
MAAKLDSLPVVYVACSGGADSVFALLLTRHYLSGRGRLESLRALHFDHGLRGADSTADAEFVRELCGALRIPLLDAKAGWGDGVATHGEAEAREARFAFFRSACGATEEEPAWIATGHHADDVVETMLMRLSRGAGLQGLSAPREVSEAGGGLVFLRPALDWSRDEIRGALSDCGIPWREDESNYSETNYRARLRREALSAWEKASDRPVRPGVARSRRLLAEDAEALECMADRLWEKCWDAERLALKRSAVEALPSGLQRRLLFRLPQGARVRAEAMEQALEALESGRELKLEVEQGVFYEFSKEWLALRKIQADLPPREWPSFVFPLGTVAYLPDGARLSIEGVAVDQALREKLDSGSNDDGRIVYLDAAGNSRSRLWVRTRAPGDAFKPLGKSSPKKLKKLFIDRKIDRRDRDRLPVFVSEGGEILWVPGVPPNAGWKLGFGCEAALRLTYVR